jgi:dienelactone hydrolase
LIGYLWIPKRRDPLPAVIFNHGSEQNPSDQSTNGQYFTSQGFVLFEPIRRGHGGNPGTYVGDIHGDEEKIHELEEQVDDVVAALAFLKMQTWVDNRRIGVMGFSYGGQMTMLTAEKDLRSEVHQGFRAAVDIAGGAESWGSQAFRDRLTLAARNAKLPVFYLQAGNDYSTSPSKELAADAACAGLPHQMMLFPDHHTWYAARSQGDESDHKNGHGGFGGTSPEEWGPWVLSFLQPHLETSLVEHQIEPQTTDPAITDHLEAHWVVRDSLAKSRGILALFLPGTGMLPSDARIILGEAAHCGYDVIGLGYPNDTSIQNLCPDGSDSCLKALHIAVIQGGSVSGLTVAQASSIQNRLAKLLQYLHTKDPGAGWDQYLNGDRPAWSKVLALGHGQGGSHAAYIGKLHKLERVVMLSAPREGSGSKAPGWFQDPPATPPDRYYSFYQVNEANAAQELDGIRAVVGAGVNPFDTDQASWPGAGLPPRILTSKDGLDPNKCTADDLATPLEPDGTPKFRKAWRYLFRALTEEPLW